MSSRLAHLAALVVLGLFAFTYGLAFACPRQLTRGFLINDEAWYAEPARNILEGRGYVTDTLYPMFARETDALPVPERFKQVGYPWMGAVVGSVVGLSDRVMVLIALVGMGLAVPACYAALVRLLERRRLALALTIVAMGTPVALSIWTAALPESWFCFLFFAAIALLQAHVAAAIAGAGFLLVAAVYFKGFAVLYLPLGLLYLAARGENLRRQLPAYLVGVLLAAVLAQVVLPSGADQLASSGGSYAGGMLLFETSAYPLHGGPFFSIDHVDPVAWILSHPIDYGVKIARMVGRTKAILEVLGGPAVGGLLLPMLLLGVCMSAYRLARDRRRLAAAWTGAPGAGRAAVLEPAARRFLLLALLAITFAFFWASNFKSRYFLHVFPFMLALAALESMPMVAQLRMDRRLGRIVVVLLLAYFAAFPLAKGLERAYRDPYAYLGRLLAARFLDYATVSEQIEEHLPPDATVMTRLAHEITWYTGRKTVFPTGDPDTDRFLADKFRVDAFYLHPGIPASERWLESTFEPVPGTDGLLWLRRAASR